MSLLFIVQKELQRCFSSPGIWLLTSFFWLVTGFYIAEVLLGSQGVAAQIAISEESGALTGSSIDIVDLLFKSLFDLLGSLCWWVLALISFGLDWRIKQQADYSRLQTALHHSLLVWGKLLARVNYCLFMLLPIVVYELIILSAVTPSVKPAMLLLAHAGLILLVTAILGFHMAIAVCLPSLLLRALASCGLFSVFWLLDLLCDRPQVIAAPWLEHISLFTGYHELVRGILPLGNVVMILSYILVAVFLTSQMLKLAALSNDNK